MKIFVSSTIKDLMYLRDELYRHLKDLGHTPWFSEKKDFPTNYHPDAMTNCLKVAEECDLFVVLLDMRAGLPYSEKDGSPYSELFGLTISEAEYRCARKKGKPICIFINKRAENECALYRQIIDEDQRNKLKLYSDPGVYEFYDRLMHEKPHVPWRYTFDSINEIMEPLKAVIKEIQPQSSDSYNQTKFKETSYINRSSVQLISPKDQLNVKLAKDYFRKNNHGSAERIIEKISDETIKSEAYSELAKDYFRKNNHNSAKKIIKKINKQ